MSKRSILDPILRFRCFLVTSSWRNCQGWWKGGCKRLLEIIWFNLITGQIGRRRLRAWKWPSKIPESKWMTVPDENWVSFLPDPSPRLFMPLSPQCWRLHGAAVFPCELLHVWMPPTPRWVHCRNEGRNKPTSWGRNRITAWDKNANEPFFLPCEPRAFPCDLLSNKQS